MKKAGASGEEGDDLFGFEWMHARPDDPDTSHGAASDTKFRAARTKLKILGALAAHGRQTSDGLKHLLGGLDCHQRVSDLFNIDHLINDSGERRLSDRGSSMIIWEINEAGKAKLALLGARPKPGVCIGIVVPNE